jgi:RNA polymerase sigma factor (TIGR02999 family)
MSRQKAAPSDPAAPGGEASPQRDFFAALYADLHSVAARELRRNFALTLSPTTVLHEAFLTLAAHHRNFNDQGHFIAYTARVMRGLIIDHLRQRNTQKHGGQYQITSLDTLIPEADAPDLAIEELGEALDVLAAVEPRLAECVELRFFCGFSLAQIGQLWQISERTVGRDWEKARLLLHRIMASRAAAGLQQPKAEGPGGAA